MRKTRAVAYISYKFNFTKRDLLMAELANAPLKDADKEFINDILKGYSYKELAYKYHKSMGRVYQWKRSLYEKLHKYDMQKIREQ